MQIILTKIDETAPNPNINIGYQKEGDLLYPIEVDLPVYIMSGWDSLKTSEVTEIVETEQDKVVKFRTNNSTYQIKYL